MSGSSRKRREYAPQFSIRFTVEERARLEREAGYRTLTAHIRHKLFDDGGPTSRKKPRKRREPPVDHVMLGQLLAVLGKSELSTSLCLLAAAAEAGALPITDETQSDIKSACAAVDEMRLVLISALGVKAR